jgi:hypothetical protein
MEETTLERANHIRIKKRKRKKKEIRNKRNSSTMRFGIDLIILSFALVGASTLNTSDGCPKNEYACLDVMNSSQCLAQLILDGRAPVTAKAMVKCVETEGPASSLTGAAKVSV